MPRYPISTVTNIYGISRTTLLYYENNGIVHPLRENNGYRFYSDEDLLILMRATMLHNLGMPIRDITNYLKAETPNSHEIIANQCSFLKQKIAYYTAILSHAEEMLAPIPEEPLLVEMPTYYVVNSGYHSAYKEKHEDEGLFVRNLPLSCFINEIHNLWDINSKVFQYLGMQEKDLKILGLSPENFKKIGGHTALRCSLSIKGLSHGIIHCNSDEKEKVKELMTDLNVFPIGKPYIISNVLLPDDMSRKELVYIPVERA